MQIFAVVPLGGGIKWQWGCRWRQFLGYRWLYSSETSEMTPAVLLSLSVWLSKRIACKVTNTDPCYQRQEYRSMTLASGKIYYFQIFKAFLRLLSSNRSAVVKIDQFAVFPMLYLQEFWK